jgi:hypothetical protein
MSQTNSEDSDMEPTIEINASAFPNATDRNFNTSIAKARIPHGEYVYSHNPPCRESEDQVGDFSECKELRVDMPLGAQILDVRLICKLLKQHGGEWKIVKSGQDVGWARFTRVKIENIHPSTSVVVVFKNWSHIYTREARIEVDWRLPQ